MIHLNHVINGLLGILVMETSVLGNMWIEEQKIPLKVPPKVIQAVPVKKVVNVEKPLLCTVKPLPKIEKKVNPFRIITPKSIDDIVSCTDHKVKPVFYANTVSLSPLSVEKKKETFINMILPSILLAKFRMKLERKRVEFLAKKSELTHKEEAWLNNKYQEFDVNDTKALYQKMAPHPTSLIIAQAIVESGWGTSKFFEEGNNVFGIWSFCRTDNRMVADKKRGEKKVYLKRYKTLEQSIHDYFLTLSTVPYYESFRKKRLETQNPFTLVEHLGKYSELGDAYIKNLKNIIRKNKLVVYDNYQLDL